MLKNVKTKKSISPSLSKINTYRMMQFVVPDIGERNLKFKGKCVKKFGLKKRGKILQRVDNL